MNSNIAGPEESTEADIIERFLPDDNRIFTMDHLEPAFRLLMIGHALGTIAFICENIHSKWLQKLMRNKK